MIEILKYTAFSWVLINFMQEALLIVDNVTPKRLRWLKSIVENGLCWKCISFWFTLGLTQDIFLASSVALTSYIIDNKIINY